MAARLVSELAAARAAIAASYQRLWSTDELTLRAPDDGENVPPRDEPRRRPASRDRSRPG